VRWYQKLMNKSLFILDPDNRVRVFFVDVIEHKYFDDFIYHLIAMNSLLLLINSPVNMDDYFNQTIDLMTNIISICFLAEALIKIVALGFVFG